MAGQDQVGTLGAAPDHGQAEERAPGEIERLGEVGRQHLVGRPVADAEVRPGRCGDHRQGGGEHGAQVRVTGQQVVARGPQGVGVEPAGEGERRLHGVRVGALGARVPQYHLLQRGERLYAGDRAVPVERPDLRCGGDPQQSGPQVPGQVLDLGGGEQRGRPGDPDPERVVAHEGVDHQAVRQGHRVGAARTERVGVRGRLPRRLPVRGAGVLAEVVPGDLGFHGVQEARRGEDAVAEAVALRAQPLPDHRHVVARVEPHGMDGGEPADGLGQVDLPRAAVALQRDQHLRRPAPGPYGLGERRQQHGVRGGAVGGRQVRDQGTGRLGVERDLVVRRGGHGVPGRVERAGEGRCGAHPLPVRQFGPPVGVAQRTRPAEERLAVPGQ